MSGALLESVRRRFPDAVVSSHTQCGDETVLVHRESLRELMSFLRDEPGAAMNMLVDVTCVDYLGQDQRFEVVYHLYSIEKKHRLRVKVRVPEVDCTIDTVCDLWKAANWLPSPPIMTKPLV